jgi:hypothetical protein
MFHSRLLAYGFPSPSIRIKQYILFLKLFVLLFAVVTKALAGSSKDIYCLSDIKLIIINVMLVYK